MMKNCFENIIIMFIMFLCITGCCSISAFADDDFEVGISNLNGTTENSAKVGDILLHPEKGWKRYDDTKSSITYIGPGWTNDGLTCEYKGSSTYTRETNVSIRFNFEGTKIRIINPYNPAQNDSTDIFIDGIKVNSSSLYSTENRRQVLVYECTNLSDSEHYFEYKFYGNGLPVLDAVDIAEGKELLPYNEGIYKDILNIEPEKEKINLNENVTANVTIDNIKEIAAEDMIIKYDSEKLKFLGAEAVDGIKVVKDDETEGQLRVILASKGKDNIANAKKVLLKLNFQGIAVGDALVDITKGKISDGIEMERDLTEDECGQAIITIEDYKDPSKDGKFTLLDLAIDGRYYGENPSTYPQYKTDVVENGAIDDDDLLQIGQYMIENHDYSFN